MDVLGLKVKLLGDAILDADTWVPQVALGLEHKQVRPGSLQSVLDFLGTKTSGTDLYLSATKLLLDKSLLLNTTLRYQCQPKRPVAGFGSAAPGKNSRSLQPEFSIAYLLRHNLAVGAEYRFKPNNLQALGAAAGLGPAAARGRLEGCFRCLGAQQECLAHAGVGGPGRIVPGVTRTSAKPVTTFRPRSRSDRAGFHLLELHHDYPTLRMGRGRSLPAGPRRRANSPDPFIHRARRPAPGAGRKTWHHAPGR